jgi:hypothetical protein
VSSQTKYIELLFSVTIDDLKGLMIFLHSALSAESKKIKQILCVLSVSAVNMIIKMAGTFLSSDHWVCPPPDAGHCSNMA